VAIIKVALQRSSELQIKHIASRFRSTQQDELNHALWFCKQPTIQKKSQLSVNTPRVK
jgi:hypothetical protein